MGAERVEDGRHNHAELVAEEHQQEHAQVVPGDLDTAAADMSNVGRETGQL